ncbi:hypothetical protein G9A89_007201 [Geosiphon pyriformis]|nr:hypothetical protein G9A89_007201 [Geosiphon pyriformis]
MPRGGLPEATLVKVAHREYWERAVSNCGHTDDWNAYYLKKHQNAIMEMSRQVLNSELEILIQNLKQSTRGSQKAVLMHQALKLQGKQASVEEPPTFLPNSPQTPPNDPPTLTMAENHEILLLMLPVTATLLPYRRILEEMRNHHTEEQSQRGRHLSLILTWSVVDWSLFTGLQSTSTSLPTPSINVPLLELVLKDSSNEQIQRAVAIIGNLIAKDIVKTTKPHIQEQLPSSFDTKEHCVNNVGVAFSVISSVLLCSLIPCRGPGSKPSKQLWTKIFQDTFLIGSEDIDTNWEYQPQIPGNSGKDSARSDFAAVVFTTLGQQFPFFIVEFEANGFSIHKDEIVVVAVFEYNKFLATAPYMTEAEVNRTCLHVGLVNETTIQLGLIKALYNEADRTLLYTYHAQNAIFKFHTGNQEVDIINAFKLMVYLKTFICQDGMTLKVLLNREGTKQNMNLLAALPHLPKKAIKSRIRSEFTLEPKRVKYSDPELN